MTVDVLFKLKIFAEIYHRNIHLSWWKTSALTFILNYNMGIVSSLRILIMYIN